MKAPLSWLREFVPIEEEPGALADRLSLSGLTVDEVVRTGAGVAGVVVGEVRAVREHPNADSLLLVRAFDGEIERDIVCGARNFGVGDRVPLALPGARLPGGVEIAVRKVRGETSDGMLCSAKELGVSEDHTGILILDADAPLGKDVVSTLEIDDVVLDLDITTNRGDLLSIIGIAREIAALYGLPLRVPKSTPAEAGEPTSAFVGVTVDDPSGCPRYVARVITGVEVGPSPWSIRRRLLACGMRPISNVVDVTNYVMLETGQPLHAFDLDRLDGGRIVVRRPQAGERITTLDGVERALEQDDVVIADGARAVAIAGVMGGEDSEVSSSTTRIVLESATFEPVRVRTTAARLGLRTEASARFEKGSDPELPPYAAARAAELLASVAGGRVAPEPIDIYPTPASRASIEVRADRVSTLIGAPQEAGFIAATARSLGCEVSESSAGELTITPPTWRPDLQREIDIVEEVARFYGYERVPARLPAGARMGELTAGQRFRRRLREVLLGAGLNEAQTLSLLPPSVYGRLLLSDDAPRALRVANPLSEDESVLRTSLIPGLLLATQRNLARRVSPVRLFEMGVVFAPDDPVSERTEVAWVLAGPAPRSWHEPERELDVFDAKGILQATLDAIGIRDRTVVRADGLGAMFNPGRAATVDAGGRTIGIVAEIHPDVAEAFESPHRIAVVSLSVEALLETAAGSVAVAPPRLPAVTRDLALVVPSTEPAGSVEALIVSAGGDLLESVRLFDVYRGDQVAEGHVSLAFSLTIRDPQRTLTDGDADAVLDRIAASASARGWTIRA